MLGLQELELGLKFHGEMVAFFYCLYTYGKFKAQSY